MLSVQNSGRESTKHPWQVYTEWGVSVGGDQSSYRAGHGILAAPPRTGTLKVSRIDGGFSPDSPHPEIAFLKKLKYS